MCDTVRRLRFRAPRVLCVVFAAFLALFALAVYHLASFWERRMDWSGSAVIEVPLVLLGLLFLLSWRDRQAAVRQARAAG